MRQALRFVVAALTITAAACALVSGCNNPNLLDGPESVLGELPAKEVIVYTYPKIIAPGDTLTVTSFAYDSSGHLTKSSAARTWQVSDPSVARLDPAPARSDMILRSLASGRVLVSSTIVGITGSDTVWVVPPTAQVTLQLSRTNFRVGDTLTAVLGVQNVASFGFTVRRVLALPANPAIVSFFNVDTLGHALLTARAPGSTTVSAALGRVRTEMAITVSP